MKKSKILLIIFIFILIALNIKKIIKQNTIITPEFRGKIVDSVTGKGIDNAVIIVKWQSKGRYLFGSSYIFNDMTIITDKYGDFLIPEYKSVLLSAKLSSILIDVLHPLYFDIKKNESLWNILNEKEPFEDIQEINDVVECNIELTPIEQFEENENYEEFWNKIEMYEKALYWKILKENNISYNINDTFKKWNQIAIEIDNLLNDYNTEPLQNNSFQIKIKSVQEEIQKNINLEKM